MNRRPSMTSHPFSGSVTRQRHTDTDAIFLHTPKKSRFLTGLRIFLLLLIALVILNLAANQLVFVQDTDIPLSALDSSNDGFTILAISDLKGTVFGQRQNRFREALSGKEYDAVVISGDMVSPLGNAQPFYDLLEVLQDISPEAPVYFIQGDTDPEAVSMENAPYGSPYAQWVLGAMQRGAVLLSSPVLLSEGDQPIWLCAASDLTMDTQSQQSRFQKIQHEAVSSGDGIEEDYAAFHLSRISGLQQARKTMKTGDICISVTHNPPESSYINALRAPSGRNTDLLLCGHWLGGLTRLPLIGSVFIPTDSLPNYGLFPGNAYNGLSRTGSTWVYCSSGLGSYEKHYPAFFRRLFNPPSVSLLHLRVSSL